MAAVNAQGESRQQLADMFAIAAAHRFTGPMTLNWKDGQPHNIEWHWKLAFGEPAAGFIRIMRGQPPPGPT